MELSLGMRRALQQCAQPGAAFAMLAMDQRGSLLKMMNPDNPDATPYADVIAVKRDVIGALSPLASAVLLDVEYGYGACVASDALSGQTGLLLALEKSGYEGDPTERRTALLEDWSVEATRKAGANGVKLLIYYRPDAPNAADQEALVSQVAQECRRWELPLFLEPLHYSLDRNVKTVPNAERRRLVIETARRLVPLGVTVLKAEFPVDVAQTRDQAEWADACAELSSVCPVPWVLLSAGVDFDTYIEQVRVACEQGASGILCGRAIWKESARMDSPARQEFLRTTGAERMRRLADLVGESARPYTDFYPPSGGETLEGWYKQE
ncbi:MAG TPA: tagatose 1,6-diphosphate aldolase [Caldilineaceae bacterium]|nr:tagatose 1,6-diphosphate aldolase [Caldilineaceae bacterium]